MNDTITKKSSAKTLILAALLAALAGAGAAALLIDISEKKNEAKNPFVRVVEITDETIDPAIWGKNFPLEYDGYLRTVDQKRTRYGGSEAQPRTPSEADPRSIVAQSRLEEDPRLRILWAGYAFSKDFREERGHAFMLEDQTYTERQKVVQQPGTCINCHASTYVEMKKLGDGDLAKGFDAVNHMKYQDARKLFDHPVSCIDCHDPQTMQLRVTRPAFMEGIRVKKALEGVADYDVNTMATRQEMRAYVCGQCHVEYYFRGPEKRLVYPWAKGIRADEILAYYDEIGFKDWVHKESGAPVLKAQHPEFEMWNQGIHARSGVTCPDCHMAYERIGAQKISDHHVQSPLLNVNHACQTCHRWSEDELKQRAHTIQDRVFALRNRAMDAVTSLIEDVKTSSAAGATPERLKVARDMQRKAQFLLDFVEAENSTGFHAPEEAERVLALSIDYARQGQIAVRDEKFQPLIVSPPPSQRAASAEPTRRQPKTKGTSE